MDRIFAPAARRLPRPRDRAVRFARWRLAASRARRSAPEMTRPPTEVRGSYRATRGREVLVCDDDRGAGPAACEEAEKPRRAARCPAEPLAREGGYQPTRWGEAPVTSRRAG